MAGPRLLLLCGGQSEEHEVSLSSARSVLQAVAGRMEVTPLVIDRSGRLLDLAGSNRALAAGSAPAGSGRQELATLGSASGGFDVVFPLLHGPNGEDGTIQGLLKLTGLPFVGSGVLGSAVGMDKIMMKTVLGAAGLPQVEWRGLVRHDWLSDSRAVLAVFDDWPYPLFVKPANLGSSIGIGKVRDREQLRGALDTAFGLDRRVIVERAVQGARELEVAVLGVHAPEASPVGEIRFQSDFYDYDTKYSDGKAELLIPADVPPSVAERCRDLAIRAFLELDLAGLARVDFFLDSDGTLLLNEVNTMPGFTETSMYPRLWQAAGLGYADLVERLVGLALQPD